MKNKFKKLGILALSIVCLMANDQTKAMDNDEHKHDSVSSNSATSSQSSQNLSALIRLLEETLSPEEIADLLKLKNEELSHGLSRNLGQWSPEGEMEKIFLRRQGEKLFPTIAPLEIYRLINDVLLPKYLGICHPRFGTKTQVDLPEEEMRELNKFLALHGERLNLLSDPNLLLTFLTLLDPLPKFGGHNHMMMGHHMHLHHPSQVCHWVHELWNYGIGPRPIPLFIQQCGGIKKGEFVTVFNSFFTQLFSNIDSYGNMMGEAGMEEHAVSKQRVRQEIIETFNKMFNFGGQQVFDIQKDGAVLDTLIPQWFTILRQVAHFELREWNKKAPRMEQLLSSLYAASSALDLEDGKFYSGLSIAPDLVSLVRTDEKNAVDRKTLRVFVEEERQAKKTRIEQYKVVKPHLSTLEKVVEWLDDIFGFVQKEGRMS